MANKYTLQDVYPDWAVTGGIFKDLQAYNVPWKNENVDDSLDLEYYGNYSGNKIIAPLLLNMLDEHGIKAAARPKLAKLCFTKFGKTWKAKWDVLAAEYDPLYNYNMDYTITEDEKADSESTQENTVTSSGTSSDTTANDVYAFNSSDASHDSKGTSSNTSSGTTTNNWDNDSESNRHLKRVENKKGNIGVTTSQQMAESELKLRDWIFFEHVFQDIDTVLTNGEYGETGADVIQISEEGYTLPVATSTTLGGVKPATKTADMTQPVGVDADGKLFIQPAEIPEPYELPIASPTTLGGVKPAAKTEEMTQEVGVDETGKLFALPGGNSNVLWEYSGEGPITSYQEILDPKELDDGHYELLVNLKANGTTPYVYFAYVKEDGTAVLFLNSRMDCASEESMFDEIEFIVGSISDDKSKWESSTDKMILELRQRNTHINYNSGSVWASNDAFRVQTKAINMDRGKLCFKVLGGSNVIYNFKIVKLS